MEKTRFNFEAIGTTWDIEIPLMQESEVSSHILKGIMERIDFFDKTYSRFRGDSLVSEIGRRSGQYVLPNDAEKILNLYRDVCILTQGKVTPLIGQVLVDAGYDAEYSLVPRVLTIPPKWEEVLLYQFPLLDVAVPTLLDVGAAGKGYLIDIVGELLEEEGIRTYFIDAGGDMRHRSQRNEIVRIGLEHPDDTSKVIGVVEFCNKSICGSSGNRRKWSQFHHIIDPHLLKSPQEVLATWVIADDTLHADMLATSLFFVPPELLLGKYDFQYVVLMKDYSVLRSAEMKVDFF